MHPNADPEVIAWWVRHPQSIAIERNTYLGDSELSKKGEKQIHPLVQEICRLEPDLILCSPMIRTTKVAFADTTYLLQIEPALSEWPRIPEMVGRLNADPVVEDYLEGRMRRFVNGEMLPSEEPRDETVQRMLQIEAGLREIGLRLKIRLKRAGRIVIISHGNRGRQFQAWLKAKGDIDRFVEEFLDSYERDGLEPAAIMPPFWYGKFFRKGIPGWNRELGYSSYLSRQLRDSEI
ncbi:MAG TPA: phosphoglycerate mutase family protein [Candidatus Paceibacterota bacterium]